jgi:hypothetical protein
MRSMFRPLLALVTATLALSGAGGSPRSSTASCPRGALPLLANSIAPASRAALAREKPTSRGQVTGALFASTDPARGGPARTQCGRRTWKRTVVVYIDLRAFHPSASLSERVSYVARFRRGYRVWQIIH